MSVYNPPLPIAFDEIYQADHKAEANYIRPKFGLKGYALVNSMLKEPNYQITKIVFAKEGDKDKKKDHFLDYVVKANKWKPAAKQPHDDWSKKSYTQGGVFLKGPKVSSTASVIAEAKKKNVPGPGNYKAKEYCGDKVIKSKSGSRNEKFNSFIEDAKWKSTQSPGPGTRNDKISHSIIERKSRAAVMWKEPANNKHDRFNKI